MAGLEGITRFFSGAGSAEDVYGRRPVVPEFPNYSDVMREITQGNIDALPSLKKLGVASTKAYSEMMEAAYPGITGLKQLGTSTIKSFLSGELPQVVQDTLKTRAAEYGVGSGTGQSEFTGAYGLRSLGIEQLKYIDEGLNSASRWISQAQNQTFDFSKMFLGPQDAIRQAEGRWSRDWLSNQVAAAPDPTARGKFDAEMSWIGMVLSAYGGGAGYTGKYNQNYNNGANSPSGNAWGTDYGHESYFGGGGNAIDAAGGRSQGPFEGTGE